MAQRAEQTLDGTAREEAVPGRAESAVLAQHCSCCLLLLFTVLSSSPKPRGQREGSFTRRERDGLSCELEAPVASKSLPVGPTSSCGLALAGSGSSTPGPLEGSSWSEDVNGLCWRERATCLPWGYFSYRVWLGSQSQIFKVEPAFSNV